MKSLSEQDKARNHCQRRTRQEIIVREGQGKKSLSEKDKAKNHCQSRTRQEISYSEGKDKK